MGPPSWGKADISFKITLDYLNHTNKEDYKNTKIDELTREKRFQEFFRKMGFYRSEKVLRKIRLNKSATTKSVHLRSVQN